MKENDRYRKVEVIVEKLKVLRDRHIVLRSRRCVS